MNLNNWQRKRMLNAIAMGSAEIVRECLEGGADPNARDRLGRTPLMRAVRSVILEPNVVDVLLEFGADPLAGDMFGMTALAYACRRLEKLGPGPDPRSRSLDEHGNLRLSPTERAQVDEMVTELTQHDPQLAADFLDMYLQERRKAALRQSMPRRELRIVIQRLDAACV
jgi:ankyrin repeat protein